MRFERQTAFFLSDSQNQFTKNNIFICLFFFICTRPFNQLKLVGNFEATDSHAWLSKCLPEIPEKVPSGDAGSYCFTSAYLGTMLQCSYQLVGDDDDSGGDDGDDD